MADRWVRGLAVLLLLLPVMVVSGFGPPTLIESETAAQPVSPHILRLMGADQPPTITATAAVVMDLLTGEVVYGKNPHQRRAQASTTKIMTALVTLEHARLDEVVTAGPNVLVEPSIIGLEPGDTLSVEQLLYGLLLPSGNDAAVDLAEHVGGSLTRFAAMMNAEADQLGLQDTHFVTASGLDAEGHYSSAYDLALLTGAALKNPVFDRIVGTREYRVDGPVRWYFRNNNQLLWRYPGADGVKTGYTDEAGRCLVFSATRDGHRAVSVVLDSQDPYADSAALLDYFFANYRWDSLSPAGSPLGSYSQEDLVNTVVARTSPNLVFPVWQTPYLRWFFSLTPGEPGEDGRVGTAIYYLFGERVAEVPLYHGEVEARSQ